MLKQRYACYDFRQRRMAMKFLFYALVFAFCCAIVACSASEDVADGGDPLSGTWVGDFGPAFYDRNTISLELHWDGKQLSGMIRPGVQGGRMYREFPPFEIDNATFEPETGAVKFDATYKPRNRRYIIEAKVKNNTLTGTWNRPEENRNGDFKLSRKSK
jgi:hypothetical protein